MFVFISLFLDDSIVLSCNLEIYVRNGEFRYVNSRKYGNYGIMISEYSFEGNGMAKKSTKSDKNIYFKIRADELDLTRAEAAELMPTISERRLEQLEYGEAPVQPADVVEMAKAYKHPDLCNYYCSHECPIGKEYVPEVKVTSLSEIVLKMLASFNNLEDVKKRLIDITEDGEISDDELPDFIRIQNRLDKLSLLVETLKLWVRNTVSQGKINEEKLNEIKEQIANQEGEKT